MPLNLATTFTELHSDNADSPGPIGSLATSLQSAAGEMTVPGLSSTGPAASIASALGAAQQVEPIGGASMLSLAQELQQEAAQAELAQQHLAAQLQAAGYLGALAGAAQGSGLRVQVVGGPAAAW